MDYRAIVRSAVCKVILIFITLSLATSGTCTEIYKWVDENGKTHFGDQRPGDKPVEVVEQKAQKSEWQRFAIKINDFSNSLSATERSDIENSVNSIYWVYDRIFYFDMYKTVPVHITLLETKTRYYEYLHGKLGKPAPRSLGMYLGKYNEIVVYVQEDRERTFRTIKHEVSHAIVDTVTPFTTSWLNEGLAEQMELLEVVDEKIIVKADRNHFKATKQGYSSGALPDLRSFLNMNSRSWAHSNQNGGYRLQAYTGSFCYFLLNTVQGRNLLIRLIHKYERGNNRLAGYVVDELYTGGVDLLETHWQSWLRGTGSQEVVLN